MLSAPYSWDGLFFRKWNSVYSQLLSWEGLHCLNQSSPSSCIHIARFGESLSSNPARASLRTVTKVCLVWCGKVLNIFPCNLETPILICYTHGIRSPWVQKDYLCNVNPHDVWWFYPAMQPNSTTATILLPNLKGKEGENVMERSQGLR